MPGVKFVERLDLEQDISSIDRHKLAGERDGLYLYFQLLSIVFKWLIEEKGERLGMKLDSRHMSGVSLQGDIAAIELNNVFQFLHQSCVSGELRVVTEHNNGSFFFQRGTLVFGALSIHQKRIGDLLVESGFITEVQLKQCLKIHAQHERRQRLGDILVRKGFVDFESLSETLKVQARESFFETLHWKQGMFFFYINQYPSKEEILINERIDHLILEGLVRMDDSQPTDK